MSAVDGLVAALERIAFSNFSDTRRQAFKALIAYRDAISPTWNIGDRVVATGHRAVILALSSDGRFAWLQPESGQPWTVSTSDMRRAPPEPTSAEILPFNEPRERPSDTEAAE